MQVEGEVGGNLYGFLRHREEALQLDAGTPCDSGGHLRSGRVYLKLWLLGLMHILEK